MATIKTEWVNLTPNISGRLRSQFVVKLDAWKTTFYYWSNSTKDANLTINGLPLALFSHDYNTIVDQPVGNGPLVIELGGAHYKGRPIQMDDQVTFVGENGNGALCALLMVKQYFIEDRPGPDRMLGDVDPNIPPAVSGRPRIVRPARPVATSRPSVTSRPLVSRSPRRDTFDR
jgi:hypothetical protein